MVREVYTVDLSPRPNVLIRPRTLAGDVWEIVKVGLLVLLVFVIIVLLFACGGGGTDPPPSPLADPPAPTKATPATPAQFIVWQIHAALADGGTVDGTFEYDRTALPVATNVQGVQPNAVYPLVSWTVTVQQHVLLPSLVGFVQGTPGHTGTICLGICRFSPMLMENVVLSNGRQTLQLIWGNPAQPGAGLPVTVEGWGVFDAGDSELRSVDAGGAFQFLEYMVRGVLSLPQVAANQ